MLTHVKKPSIIHYSTRTAMRLQWMRLSAPLVNQQVIHQRWFFQYKFQLWLLLTCKCPHSPNSGSKAVIKLLKKDNHVCKSSVQPLYSRNLEIIQERERCISYCPREKSQQWENKKKCIRISFSVQKDDFYEHALSELLCEHLSLNICLKL